MKVYAEDSIYGLLDQIKKWNTEDKEEVMISMTDLNLLMECYEEDLEELERKSDCITIEVPISQCDIDSFFGVVVEEDEIGQWEYTASSGQEVRVNFVKEKEETE